MKNLTSLAGWTLLVAVLAVPSFLFYNWWSGNKLKASAEAAQPAVQADIFSKEKEQRGAVSPQQPPSASAQAPAPQAAQVPAQTPAYSSAAVHAAVHANPAGSRPPSPAPSVKPEEGPIMDQPAAQPAAQPKPAPQAAVSTSTPAAAVPVASSTMPAPVSSYSPKSDRDPTLSPADYTRIRAEERRRKESELAALQAARRRSPEAQIDSRLQLQGIVGTAAIINGEMYSAGQTVAGARILKVGFNYIIGEYKGRKFRKVLQ